MTGPYMYDTSLERNGARQLAERYDGAAAIEWDGHTVHPMYSAPLGADPTVLTLTLLRAAPPAGLLGLGVGVSVLSGHVALEGRRIRGVDVWTDALSGGVEVEVCGAGPDAGFTITPVWMTGDGATVSWSGNYGVVIERSPSGRTLLRCSTGVGVPDFGELVVEMGVSVIETDQSRYRGALYDLGVAMHGRGDIDQACTLWTQAADFGHLGAAYDLGVVCFRQGDLIEAERWWRTAADHGDIRAMAGLAEVLDRQGNSQEARVWRAFASGQTQP
ncbi:tetratricopeptide repeat protein [Nocardia alni]|uniref:tetratricopeptide repeat protein n=1 Tax=Nocardia alni TaxID=2815723 RepID=UPI001C220748|nr:tetratricopeptide repeat protein [Nocardia alni]